MKQMKCADISSEFETHLQIFPWIWWDRTSSSKVTKATLELFVYILTKQLYEFIIAILDSYNNNSLLLLKLPLIRNMPLTLYIFFCVCF